MVRKRGEWLNGANGERGFRNSADSGPSCLRTEGSAFAIGLAALIVRCAVSPSAVSPIMDETSFLNITPVIAIPRAELQYRATRAGGPGGQHVNTSSTRIELLWDIDNSRAVDDVQRARIRTRLAARLDSEGMVRVVASDRRSQQQNRDAADERLASLVRHALHVPKKRKATKPTRAAKEKRLTEKKKHSDKKKQRRVDLD